MVKIENLKNLIIEIRGQIALLDSDVANIYGVETKRINEAVKNNPDKFPQNYLFELSQGELVNLRSKISTAKLSKTRVVPKAFTEKGMYMLATILKSPIVTQANDLDNSKPFPKSVSYRETSKNSQPYKIRPSRKHSCSVATN